MATNLKVLTLNVEGHKHVERVQTFLTQHKPEVVCLQEVFKVDLPGFAACLSQKVSVEFAPTLIIDRPNDFGFAALGEYGIAILSVFPMTDADKAYYFGHRGTIPLINDRDSNTPSRPVLWADIKKAEQTFRISTTHFTWSPDGKPCLPQWESLKVLLQIYHDQIQTGLLCGDFNVPRGNELYQKLIQEFQDNIPPEVTTSLDSEFHRHPELELMVDYLFTKPGYQVSEVQLHRGLSDHQAVSGILERL